MAITYPLNFPTSGGISEITWKKESSVSSSESPFSKNLKVYDWGGKRLEATIKIAPMRVAQAKTWEAWFMALNGLEGTFWLTPSLDSAPSGGAGGTPLVNGASQTGQSLVTDGWDPSETGILKAGDWFQLGNHLYRVLQDANSDVGGNATFDIWPGLRSSPGDDDPLTISGPKGIFRVIEMPSLKYDRNQLCAGFQFDAIEAI